MRAVWLLLFAGLCAAEIVDRVAVNIGHHVITETEVVGEARMEAFLDASQPDLSDMNKRKVLDRLVEQYLIRRELEFTRFTPVADQEVEPLFQQTMAQHPGALPAGITRDQVREHVAWTLTMMRFIEYRFAPAVQISDQQIRQEYRRQAAAFLEKNKTPAPPIDQMRFDLEKLIRQRLVTSALDRWLGEVRTQTSIVYHEGYKL